MNRPVLQLIEGTTATLAEQANSIPARVWMPLD